VPQAAMEMQALKKKGKFSLCNCARRGKILL